MSVATSMSVKTAMLHEPESFDFVQVLRLLKAMNQTQDSKVRMTPDVMPTGAPGDVTSVSLEAEEVKIKLGLEALSGCRGLIPDYLYAELLNCLHQDDSALQQFLDVFNQRYYEIRLHVESTASLLLKEEREQFTNKAINRLTQKAAIACMFSLPNANQDKTDTNMIRYGLALGNKSRNLNGLKRLLSDFFQLTIRPVVSPTSLYRVHPQHQSRLGAVSGNNNRLGQGFWLGSSGNQAFKALEIYITPKTKGEYMGLLNNLHFAQSMKSLVQAYLRESLDIKLYMYVRREYIDEPKLSRQAGMRLGETNCLAPHRHKTEYRKILIQQERV